MESSIWDVIQQNGGLCIKMLNYLYLILIIGYCFLIVGLLMKEYLLVWIMGMLLVVAGLNVVTGGLGGNNNDLTQIFGALTATIGSVFFLKEAMYWVEQIEI